MHRYKELAKELGISVLELERQLGLSPTTIHKAIHRNSRISMDIVYKIIDKYPHVNKQWLTTGKGKILNTVSPSVTEPQTPAIDEGWERVSEKPNYLLTASDMEVYAAIRKEFEGRNIYEVLAEMYVRIKNLEKQNKL